MIVRAVDVGTVEYPVNAMPQAFEGEFPAPLQPRVHSQPAMFPTHEKHNSNCMSHCPLKNVTSS